MDERKKVLARCRRIVVKAGTRLLTDPELIPVLIKGISGLRKAGYSTLLVSSGAVGTGIKMLKLQRRPRKLSEIQALAALGQGRLMELYNDACEAEGFFAAQLLLTRDDLRHRERYLNVLTCIETLWSRGILPIVNENDSVSVDELKFSDNDILSGMLAAMTKSELTVILTTESGLRERVDGKLGNRVSVVREITREILDSAGGTDNSIFSVGGMSSKLNAAELVTRSGGSLIVADGRDPDILARIAAGEDVGTLFIPRDGASHPHSRKLWISAFSKVMGRLVVDEGAATALLKGASLLPAGVRQVQGHFDSGDTVELVCADGKIVGRGIANFSSAQCFELHGLPARAVKVLMGNAHPEEVVHHDNLSLCL